MATEIGRLLTAMLTPFKADGSVNYEAAEKLAVLLVADGSDGVVVSGTTGESPALSDDEKIELLKVVKKAIPRHSVVMGSGSNDTHHSVKLSERAMKAGADALLAVVPYYNKPPQEGMYQHFKAISEVGPTVMYNIKGRTAINMTAATTLRCAQLPGIIGVKEASGDLDQIGLVCAGRPVHFNVWSGDDSWTLPVLAVGGHGVICVVSHIAGRAMKAGADALLAVVPYYNKPPQEGMYQHFKAISEVGPTIMYNIQGRTAINMSAATTLRCAQLPGIIGVKEASGDLDQIGLVCAGKPEHFKVWSGDDSWTLPLLAVGGDGVICVVSHIAGRSMKKMIEAHEKADNLTATKIHQGLLPVIKTLMTTAANPVPIKSALNAMGFPTGPFRLPLVPLTDEQLKFVMQTIGDAGDLITFKTGVKVA